MVATDSVVTINKCIFSNNYFVGNDVDYDRDYGGAVMVNHSILTVQESIFSNNTISKAYGKGGAIYAVDSEMIVDGLVATLFFTNVAEDVRRILLRFSFPRCSAVVGFPLHQRFQGFGWKSLPCL